MYTFSLRFIGLPYILELPNVAAMMLWLCTTYNFYHVINKIIKQIYVFASGFYFLITPNLDSLPFVGIKIPRRHCIYPFYYYFIFKSLILARMGFVVLPIRELILIISFEKVYFMCRGIYKYYSEMALGDESAFFYFNRT